MRPGRRVLLPSPASPGSWPSGVCRSSAGCSVARARSREGEWWCGQSPLALVVVVAGFMLLAGARASRAQGISRLPGISTHGRGCSGDSGSILMRPARQWPSSVTASCSWACSSRAHVRGGFCVPWRELARRYGYRRRYLPLMDRPGRWQPPSRLSPQRGRSPVAFAPSGQHHDEIPRSTPRGTGEGEGLCRRRADCHRRTPLRRY